VKLMTTILLLVKVGKKAGEAGEAGDPAVGQSDACPPVVPGELMVYKLQLASQTLQVADLGEREYQHHLYLNDRKEERTKLTLCDEIMIDSNKNRGGSVKRQ
jgi:hypothetical protein